MAEKKGLSNAGKKDTRQVNQILDKAVKEGRYQENEAAREVDGRMAPKQHAADRKNK